MNDNNQQINNTAKKASDHKVSAKRRTLVKGTIGALPAVLTLRSGAAFALSSSEMCVPFDKAKAASDRPTVISGTYLAPSETAYVRTETVCHLLTEDDVIDPAVPDEYTVYLDPVDGLWRGQLGAASYPSGDDSLTKTFVLQGGVGPKFVEDGTVSPTYTAGPNTPCFILAYMDNTGYKTGAIGNATVDAGGTLPYITNSCWVSATPTP